MFKSKEKKQGTAKTPNPWSGLPVNKKAARKVAADVRRARRKGWLAK